MAGPWDYMAPEERVKAIAALGPDKHSTRELAAKLGATPGSIAGYIDRHFAGAARKNKASNPKTARRWPRRAPARKAPPAEAKPAPAAKAKRRERRPAQPKKAAPPVVTAPDNPPVTLLEAGRAQCRFPLWAFDATPAPEEQLVCGASTEDDASPWCAHHKRIVYQRGALKFKHGRESGWLHPFDPKKRRRGTVSRAK